MLEVEYGRRTQVVKGEVCKTSMQRFESARRLQILRLFMVQIFLRSHCGYFNRHHTVTARDLSNVLVWQISTRRTWAF
jgi:hypothetical protein